MKKLLLTLLSVVAVAFGQPTMPVKNVRMSGTNQVLDAATLAPVGTGTITATNFASGTLLSTALDLIGSTRGSILYRGATAWTALTPGTSGYVLTSNGAGADPSWQVSSGLPTQTGQNGKFLTTNGTVASWATVAGGGDLLAANNLSELTATAATARTNIGVAIGTDVPRFIPLASKGLILGDSTIAAYAGGLGIETFLLSTADTAAGTTITNSAVPGHTIDQQKAVWVADANKATYDWIVVEIGLNDVTTTDPDGPILARYQSLIDTINAGKKSTAIVVVATMTPAKLRWITSWGAGPGAAAQTQWGNMNIAIMGGGANAITGVSYRVDAHTTALGDGLGALALAYDTGDGIHENNAARAVIASAWRNTLNTAGHLGVTHLADVRQYFNSSNNLIYLKDGFLGLGTTTPNSKLHVEVGAQNTRIAAFSYTGGFPRATIENGGTNGYSAVLRLWNSNPDDFSDPDTVLINTYGASYLTGGNLLIGGKTDVTGTGLLKTFGTTDATSTTSGNQFAGGVGIAQSLWVGGLAKIAGNITASGTGTQSFAGGLSLTTVGLAHYLHDSNGWIWTTTGNSAGTVKGGIYEQSGSIKISANADTSINPFIVETDGDVIASGRLINGSGTTVITDSVGKVLSAALNTVGVAQGGTATTNLTLNNIVMGNNTNAVKFLAPGAANTVVTSNGTAFASTGLPHQVTFVISGGGSAITTGVKDHIANTKYGGTLTSWSATVSPADTITFDILRSADGGSAPSSSIVGGSGTKPSVASGVNAKSTTFTDWTSTTVTAYDNFKVQVTAVGGTATSASVTLYFQ